MIEQFEKFAAGPFRPSSERMYVSLSSKGTLLMNRNAYEAFGVPDAVVLFFDKKNSIIALSAAHKELREAFPVKSKDGHWFIQASPFCRHFGIRIEKTEQFLSPDIDSQGRLRLDLTQTVSVAQRKPRSRKTRR